MSAATPTAAWLKVQAERDLMNPEREKIIADDFSSVVYLYTNHDDKPCAVGYRGRAKRAAFRYYYASEDVRTQRIKAWMNDLSVRKQTPRTIALRALKVDDVLCASWGYDQTNIDYFKVTRLVGKRSVELVWIGQHRTTTGYLCGQCTPDPDNVTSEPFIKRTCNHSGAHVNIDSVRSADKVGYELVDGIRIYKSNYWSSYA